MPLTAVVLAGGLGTRLRPAVADRPKSLAEINGEPFIALQLRRLRSHGVERALICVGHLSQQVIEALGDGSALGLRVDYAVEHEPLGTAGALKNAAPQLVDEPELLLLNGDTFLEVDPNALLETHRQGGGVATLCVWRATQVAGRGVVELDDDGRVLSFAEKARAAGAGWINAGVYLLSAALLRRIPAGRAVSLEREVLPGLLAEGLPLHAHHTSGTFIDIGTPEDFRRAQTVLGPFGRANNG